MAKHRVQETWEQRADRMIAELNGPKEGRGRHTPRAQIVRRVTEELNRGTAHLAQAFKGMGIQALSTATVLESIPVRPRTIWVSFAEWAYSDLSKLRISKTGRARGEMVGWRDPR